MSKLDDKKAAAREKLRALIDDCDASLGQLESARKGLKDVVERIEKKFEALERAGAKLETADSGLPDNDGGLLGKSTDEKWSEWIGDVYEAIPAGLSDDAKGLYDYDAFREVISDHRERLAEVKEKLK